MSRRVKAIRRLNNTIAKRLCEPRPSIISDKWRHDTSQDWHLLSLPESADSWTDLIPDKVLVGLKMHISALGYLEGGASRFTDVTEGLGQEEELSEHDLEEPPAKTLDRNTPGQNHRTEEKFYLLPLQQTLDRNTRRVLAYLSGNLWIHEEQGKPQREKSGKIPLLIRYRTHMPCGLISSQA